MPCLLVLLALLTPRVLIVLLWLFTDWFVGMFASILWPVLGLILLPTTLLWYSTVHNWYGGVWQGWHIAVLVVAVVIDVGPASGRLRG
jgi:hypothetical protein